MKEKVRRKRNKEGNKIKHDKSKKHINKEMRGNRYFVVRKVTPEVATKMARS